jgi:hypothetical protein
MGKTIVGKLYMNKCGHCEMLEQPWNEMKNKVGGKVTVAEDIEASETRELAELNKKHGVNVEAQGGYPTIYKIKPGGNVEYYNGERNAKELIRWAIKNNKDTLKHGGNKKQESNKKSNKKSKKRRNRTSRK